MDAAPAYSAVAESTLPSGALERLSDDLLFRALSHLPSWTLASETRLVCRRLAHLVDALLHQRYADAYTSLVRPPFTTAPLFQRADCSPSRELAVLHSFALSLAHLERLRDESDLHLLVEGLREPGLDSPSWVEDIFGRQQPVARLEDLVYAQLVERRWDRGDPNDVSLKLGKREIGVLLPAASTSSTGRSVRKELLTLTRPPGVSLETLADSIAPAISQQIEGGPAGYRRMQT